MIPAIGPKTAVFFVLAVFVLAVFVLAVFVLAVFGPKPGQSRAKVRFLMFFPLAWAGPKPGLAKVGVSRIRVIALHVGPKPGHIVFF